jgi:spermidine/putrescine transport system permease protein
VKKLGKVCKAAYLGLVVLFMYLPIAIMIGMSFTDSRSATQWRGFSFDAYANLFRDRDVSDALIVTLTVAAISSVLATIIGTATAIGMHSMKKRPRTVVESFTQLPMVNPDLVTGISMMLLFAFIGISSDLGYLRLVIAHTTFNIPYVIFSVLPKLRQSSDTLYDAAMDLGCSPFQALFKVVIPDIMPGIVSGLILAFTLSIDDFAVSLFTGGATKNLSMLIFSKTAKGGVNTKFCALSALMFLVVAVLLLIVNLRSMKQEKEADVQNKKVMRKS